MKKCPRCGAELADDAKVCSSCGAKFNDENTYVGLVAKILLALAILFLLFFGGMILWNKLYYNPELDGDVYPGMRIDKSEETMRLGGGLSAALNKGTEGKDYLAKLPLADKDKHDFDVSKLNFEDFDFYGQYMYEGMPEEGERIYLKYANGDWRYNFVLRNDQSNGSLFSELGFAEIYVDGKVDPPVGITLHPRLATDGFEVWEESDKSVGYEPFKGGIENNDIKLIGNDCVVVLKDYYVFSGREYLIAQIWLSEEEFGDLLFVRGQD